MVATTSTTVTFGFDDFVVSPVVGGAGEEPVESATATPTSTPTSTPTATATPTPGVLAATVPTDQETHLQTADADLALTFPAGFSTAAPALEVRVAPGAEGPFRLAAGGTGLRAFQVTAATAGGQAVTTFQAPVTICAAFAWASAQNLDQTALAPYWTDPATGALRTEGLARVSLEPATPSQPGRLCFTTTHFTEFLVAAGATPAPTVTPIDAQRQPDHRVLIPSLLRDVR
jgi:hypothetical protein